jgi:hypothetical protein
MNWLGISVSFSEFSVPSVLKLFPVGSNGFNTEGTENSEKAMSQN